MMKLNTIAAFLMFSLSISMSALPVDDGMRGGSTLVCVNDFREALKIYDRGMLSRSKMVFDQIWTKCGKADPAAYSLLCDIKSAVPGYSERMESFMEEYPYSILIPQIKFYHALNLFDRHEYEKAHAVFSQISEKSLYRDQRVEYVFKKAYSCLELGNIQAARQGFAAVEERGMTDYTAPSRYGIAYVEYLLKNFNEALKWFRKSANDGRFKEMSEYYILECLFMLKDYDYVMQKGEDMYKTVPADRKPHLARIISESYLVKGHLDDAKRFYELSLSGGGKSNTRADWFYSGSMLYAVADYKGAIENFSKMGERRDSIGQIASYNLGYSYIQTKDKVSAMGAFKEASELYYDVNIAEDAFFNYAKLAFDLNHDISGFNAYLKKYYFSGKAEQIYSYIAVAALYDHDYAAAIEAYDKIDELDGSMRQNYMKANYLRANQLVASGSYRKAIPCLKASAYYSRENSRFNQLSRFWLAESYYRNDQYAEARNLFMNLYNVSALYGLPESSLIPYNIAYCHFKEKNYQQARKWFGEYLAESSVRFRKEALLRMADCDFVAKNYKLASEGYESVLKDYFDVNDIYSYYQAALSHGLNNNNDRKIELLSNVLQASSDAEFYPEALFELGRAYAIKEDADHANECFNKLAASVKDSTFVAMAYIEMGSLARNQSMFNEALGYYKTVVEEMPLSEYADNALLSIEAIYQTKNESEEYIAYIEKIGKGAVKSEDEKEIMIFNSAEQVFLSENYQKALVALQNYQEKYPKGQNVYKSDFYMAESYKKLGKLEHACDYYSRVVQNGSGSFVELSLLNYANLSYRLERWDDAYKSYESLTTAAKLENNAYAAVLGMMRSAFRGHEWTKAAANADKVIADSRTEASVKSEADYIRAKSYLAVSRRDEAFAILEKLSADMTGAYGAEAAFMLIQDCYDRGEFDKVETKVYAFADAGSGQTYWLARSFVVLGDSFMERDDVEQAKATFESVRDGYTPTGDGDDILDSVRMRLKKIEEIAGKQQN